MRSERRRRERPLRPPLEELERLYAEGGPTAIATLRQYDPGAYLKLIARLIAD
jgi:hypothetical protein